MGHLPTVKDIMTRKVITLRPDQTIGKAVETLTQNNISGAPFIDDDDNLVGILSERDCLSWLVNLGYYEVMEGNVGDYMSEDVQTIKQGIDLFAAAAYFVTHHYRRLPVLGEKDQLVGIISRRDVIVKGVGLSFDRIIEAPDPGYLPPAIKARLGSDGVRHLRKHKH